MVLDDLDTIKRSSNPARHNRRTKEVWEIKTINEFFEGQLQLEGYLVFLNVLDGGYDPSDATTHWHRGEMSSFDPPHFVTVPEYYTIALVNPSLAGVITYEAVDPVTFATVSALVSIALSTGTGEATRLTAQAVGAVQNAVLGAW